MMPLNDFLEIYLLTFLEIGSLFFSPDLEKLNIFMYILRVLNYPLINSNYFWHIESFSKKDINNEDKMTYPILMGINDIYDPKLDYSNLKNINFIVDMEKKSIKSIEFNDEEKNEDIKEINELFTYLRKIINKKKIKSYFLNDCIITLKDKLKVIRDQEYLKKV